MGTDMTAFTVKNGFLYLKEGETVYPYTGHTYGCVTDDEAIRGVECCAVTKDPAGGTPFIVVARSDLVEKII